MQSVTSAQPTQIGTKRVDEKGFFDVSDLLIVQEFQIILFVKFQLKTCRRTYNFYAVNASLAQEWIEKIQACLQ